VCVCVCVCVRVCVCVCVHVICSFSHSLHAQPCSRGVWHQSNTHTHTQLLKF